MGMDPKTTELERGFQLAESGDCRSVDEIRRKLIQEGYYATQITGKSLLRQLQALISAALDARQKHLPSGERPKGSKRPAHTPIPVDRANASNGG
jgi:hypothetical protein